MAKKKTKGLQTIKYIQKKGPAAEDFPAYRRRIEAEFLKLLDSNPSESKVQQFLERNPPMVPGGRTPGNPSGFVPHLNACITQPRLPGIKGKIPDFLWFSMHSQAFYAAFVEVEKPDKKIFRKSGVPTAEFTQARDQLADWQAWFNDSVNQMKFRSDYGITDAEIGGRPFELHLILVYGRRSETQGNRSLSQKRRYLLTGANEELMSFDRLFADQHLEDSLTVTLSSPGKYRVNYIPPTFSLSPQAADEYLSLIDLDKAIQAQSDWKKDRKNFLKERLKCWMDWVKKPQPGFRAMPVGFRE